MPEADTRPAHSRWVVPDAVMSVCEGMVNVAALQYRREAELVLAALVSHR